MSLRDGWTEKEYRAWTDLFGVMGVGMAFVWLGSDYWFFGLWSVVSLVMAFWASIEADRSARDG